MLIQKVWFALKTTEIISRREGVNDCKRCYQQYVKTTITLISLSSEEFRNRNISTDTCGNNDTETDIQFWGKS